MAYHGKKVVPPLNGRTTSCISRARAPRIRRGQSATASRLGDLNGQLGTFLHFEGGSQRLMGDQILELLDLGHIGGRNGQHQGDAIGDVQTGVLAGVLDGADGVAGIAFGEQIGVKRRSAGRWTPRRRPPWRSPPPHG